jgi:carnitine O-acetyltransferase
LIAAHPENKDLLHQIQTSSFLVCLDDSSPVTRDEVSRACWHGDGRNRFFDKPLQFIVFENGKAGFNGEVRNHTFIIFGWSILLDAKSNISLYF